MITTVIPVRNKLGLLHRCLSSFAEQKDPPEFNIVVVDDGSTQPIEASQLGLFSFGIRVVRQVPLGISAARNHGVNEAVGDVILFVDSDVVLGPDFLRNLSEAMDRKPASRMFQTALDGGPGGMANRMEGLRLRATQRALANENGHIRYANTSALAIRKSFVEAGRDLFDTSALRGEDTLLLARLIDEGELPVWVPDARALHMPELPVWKYIRKHLSIGYHTAGARNQLGKRSSEVLLGSEGRRNFFKLMVSEAAGNPLDMVALSLIVVAHGIERLGRLGHGWAGLKVRERQRILSVPVDCIRENDLVSTIASKAARGDGSIVTYITAWTLVQADEDKAMSDLLAGFDICYPDGMGVVLCSFLLNRERLHKVTANSFFENLCAQVAVMGLPMGIVGSTHAVADGASRAIREKHPAIQLVACSHGFMEGSEEAEFENTLRSRRPRLLVVGMGQPTQERWVMRVRAEHPETVFLCVGGLFDYICGVKPTPPAWMRSMGFEWFYILLLCPRRYWRRYILGLPKLAQLVLFDAVGIRRNAN